MRGFSGFEGFRAFTGSRRAGVRVPALAPLGARLVFAGDSKFSINGSPGARSIQLQTVEWLAGRVRMAVAGDQAISGNTIAQLAARIGFTIAQQADITVVGIGHNSLGDGSASVIAALTSLHASLRAGLGSKYIVWTTVLPSATSAGGLYPADNATLVAVNNWIMGLDGTDGGKTKACNFGYRATDFPLFDPLTMCYPEGSSPTQYIHPNARGAAFNALTLASLIDQIVEERALEAAFTDVLAGSDYGPNLDPRNVFSGTGGTKTGATAPTGNVVDGWDVTNGTSCAVACSVGSMLGKVAQIIDITGNAAAEGTVVFTAQNVAGARVPFNGVLGEFGEALIGYKICQPMDDQAAAVGLLQHGRHLGGFSRSRYSSGVYTATDASLGPGPATALGPRVARTQAGLVRGSLSNLATTNYGYGVRVAAGPVNLRLILFSPICRRIETAAYTAPVYMGLDGIQGTSERLGNSANAVNLTIGVSYNFQPGLWSGGGLVITNLLEISTNGGATYAPVTGTTNNGYTWTAAGASGNLIRQTVTATNALGTATEVWNGTLA